jgi:putative RNA 2'-phosphotransferase
MGDVVKAGKKLSWLLRHGALESGLAMDSAGFANIADVLVHTGLTRAELDVVVAENNKSRYEVDGDRIRASQGHSLAGTPVTLAGLEATWQIVESDDVIFHGTNVDAARTILREGMEPMARTHVHLAESEDATVGKRANVDVLLAVSAPKVRAAGFVIYRAPNGVVLARRVPKDCIVDVIAQNGPRCARRIARAHFEQRCRRAHRVVTRDRCGSMRAVVGGPGGLP